MENRVQNDRYQALRQELENNAQQFHHRNKLRIKAGIISLFVLPFVLCFVRWVTESDKIVFMLIWILLMFILCSYLIGVGYMDDWLQKILGEMTGEEESFDSLLADPDEMKGRPFYRIMGFVVDRNYRSRGIGGGILEKAVRQVYDEFGPRPLALGVHRENLRAGEFYIRHGFKPTGVYEGNDEYYLRVNV